MAFRDRCHTFYVYRGHCCLGIFICILFPVMFMLVDLYHPNLAQAYRFSFLLSLFLTTPTLILALHVVWTRSKNATSFKILLVNQLFWSYLFFLSKKVLPGYVTLYPIPGFYYVGLLKDSEMDVKSHMIIADRFIAVGQVTALVLSGSYRICFTTSNSRFKKLFGEPKNVVYLILGTLFVPSLFIVGMLIAKMGA